MSTPSGAESQSAKKEGGSDMRAPRTRIHWESLQLTGGLTEAERIYRQMHRSWLLNAYNKIPPINTDVLPGD